MNQNHFCKLSAALLLSSFALFGTSAVSAAANDFWQIVNVDTNDKLNMRAGAGTNYPVVGSIPYNGRTIVATGRTEGNWVEVSWLGSTGWVNSHYLSAMTSVYKGPVTNALNNMDSEVVELYRPTKEAIRPKFASQQYWKARPYWKQPNVQ